MSGWALVAEWTLELEVLHISCIDAYACPPAKAHPAAPAYALAALGLQMLALPGRLSVCLLE